MWATCGWMWMARIPIKIQIHTMYGGNMGLLYMQAMENINGSMFVVVN